MNGSSPPADLRERERALDPGGSFIVQAPAGSGKTELLIQRYLRLLSVVDVPEEILAITFTRKAAGEMRARVEQALTAARARRPPSEPHLRRGYDLACNVIQRDLDRGWGLCDQPARLRISTIDSVNSRLSRSAPLSVGLTAQNPVLEDARPLYREAARETLALADEGEQGEAVRALLAHCDNDATRVENLLQTMLGRRDQWLEHTGSGRAAHGDDLRPWLEESLRDLVERYLEQARALIPVELEAELVTCLAHAGRCLSDSAPDHAAAVWCERTTLPATDGDELAVWRGIAVTLLRRDGQWRRQLTKNDGFPVGDTGQREMKARALELLAQLEQHDDLRDTLGVVLELPEPRYGDAQWRVIQALWQVLPWSVAILKGLFDVRGRTDYSEIAQEAIRALGPDDAATELRLALDYQIKHVLLDEFQDTSRSQCALLERLTEGWENEADRSVFLVGDPMQSIYRFREAEVALFIETARRGLGGMPLEFLQLRTNFRSQQAVVEWFNGAFAQVFPARSDSLFGAVEFTASAPYRDDVGGGVHWHPVPARAPDLEAERVVGVIREALDSDAAGTVGVLVRSRRHAVAIARQLREAGVDHVATGLEQLEEQPVVQDLLALTRAVTHLGDRLAWLACLRSPWCGLRLADLHSLAAGDHAASIWSRLEDPVVVGALSEDARARLARCMPILRAALARRGAIPLRDLVENAWVRLGGPATLDTPDELEPVERYLAFLDTFDVPADCVDAGELHEAIAEHFVDRGAGSARVQILTMHKAKGLEFDTVILPGLGLTTRAGDKPLLLFDEISRNDGTPGLVVAPIAPGDRSRDPIYSLLWSFETRRDRLEQDRLLYVAITRARKHLHLFAQLQLDSAEGPGIRAPASNTLLARLWPVAAREIDASGVELTTPPTRSDGERRTDWHPPWLRRLSADWREPAPPGALGVVETPREPELEDEVDFEWASQWAKHVGSVVHRWLQHIAEDGLDTWDAPRIAAEGPRLRTALRRTGVAGEHLDDALRRTIDALRNTLADDDGRWILSSEHAAIENEWPVTTGDATLFVNHVIDRTFVDADGVRWIVDYKTGWHAGGKRDAFLASETERYRPQLKRYRDAIAALDERPIRTALYFPLLRVLHEVDCDAS
ncbi:MAG: UvrD-helicase domain-containing protein [Gammaproteobacteria bacterium]